MFFAKIKLSIKVGLFYKIEINDRKRGESKFANIFHNFASYTSRPNQQNPRLFEFIEHGCAE